MIDIDRITGEIRALEHQLEEAFAKQRAGLNYGLERGRIQFETEVARRHRALKRSLALYLIRARPLVVITAPLIYSLIIPFALTDLWVSLYQAVCFRVYGIPQVKRARYFILDRAGLPYLNALEKLNCGYCTYVNGVIAYVREVGARTEQYWCPIKHAKRVLGAHPRYAAFEDYGDGAHYQQRLKDLRRALTDDKDEFVAAEIPPLAEVP
jgi:hypothetical protein